MTPLFDVLDGTIWRLVELDSAPLAPGDHPVPVLWFGKGWCSWRVVNTTSAETLLDGDVLRVKPRATTLIGSSPDAMTFERRFHRLMVDAPLTLALVDAQLVAASSSVRLRFTAAQWPV